jgi:hypothetical protein
MRGAKHVEFEAVSHGPISETTSLRIALQRVQIHCIVGFDPGADGEFAVERR